MTATTTSTTPVTTKNKIGLLLAGLLGVADLIGLVIPPGSDDVPGPPFGVLVVSAVLGVITLAAVVYTWRTGNRVGARVVAVSRILSIFGSIPAFFVDGVPPELVVAVAVQVVLTALAIVLIFAKPTRA